MMKEIEFFVSFFLKGLVVGGVDCWAILVGLEVVVFVGVGVVLEVFLVVVCGVLVEVEVLFEVLELLL